MKKNSCQRGNILFLILLAIILFAALSYAVTSGMRGGGTNASKESAQSGAAALQNYVALLRSEIQRMILVKDCALANLDWRHPYVRYNGQTTAVGGGTSGLTATTAKAGCNIFSTSGGPIGGQTFERYINVAYDNLGGANPTIFKAGHAAIRWVSRVGEKTDAADIAIIFAGTNMDICRYLVDPTMNTAIPNDDFSYGTNPQSAAPGLSGTSQLIDDPANLYKDFFMDTETLSGVTYCTVGAILAPQ